MACIACCCLATVARAGSYTDFNTGLSANGRGDSDAAIASLTRAIDAGDLAPSLRPSALTERAIAFSRKARWADAVSDLQAVLKLKPESGEAYIILAEAQTQLKNYDAAVDSFKHALAQDKQSGSGIMNLARLEWEAGRFHDAAVDTERAESLGANGLYDALWEVIAHNSAGMDVRIQWLENARAGDKKWPRAIVDVYLQRENPEDARQAARQGVEEVVKGQLCEADFYLSELQREHNDLAAARSGFTDAVKSCPHHFVEYNAAQAALGFPSPQASK